MATDVQEGSLTIEQQLVENARLSRVNEWETVKGYINTATGLTDLKNGIEVTDDQSDDRFLIFQSGTTLYRLDYGTGYGDGTPAALTLPSGVTISAGTKCRFFYYQAVVVWVCRQNDHAEQLGIN